MTLSSLNTLMAETYLVKDQQFLKVVVCNIVANRLKVSPVWMFVVGAPGSGKTEFLNTVSGCEGITEISSMTTSTLISGMMTKGPEPSLLMSMPKEGGVLLFKDFTSVLSLYNDARQVIIGQLREIYDGKYHKLFGNGKNVDWEGRMGLLAAVTDVIHTEREKYSAMGDRFIIFHPDAAETRKERINVTKRSMSNVSQGMKERRQEIAKAVKEYLDVDLKVLIETYNKIGMPNLPDAVVHSIAELAEFTSRARSGVKRDQYAKGRPMTYAHDPEFPTRIAEQLTSMAIALMVINEHDMGECILTADDKHLLYRISLDSLPPPRRKVLQRLTKYVHATAYAIANDMGYPYGTIKYWLEELDVLKVVDSKKYENGKTDWWLRVEYRALMAEFEGIVALGEEMPEPKRIEEVDVVGLPSF